VPGRSEPQKATSTGRSRIVLVTTADITPPYITCTTSGFRIEGCTDHPAELAVDLSPARQALDEEDVHVALQLLRNEGAAPRVRLGWVDIGHGEHAHGGS
jgi:hypothetical protein